MYTNKFFLCILNFFFIDYPVGVAQALRLVGLTRRSTLAGVTAMASHVLFLQAQGQLVRSVMITSRKGSHPSILFLPSGTKNMVRMQ